MVRDGRLYNFTEIRRSGSREGINVDAAKLVTCRHIARKLSMPTYHLIF